MLERLKDIAKNKRMLIICVLVLAAAVVVAVRAIPADFETVEFTPLSSDRIPQDIQSSVIPQYRDLERALACVVDDKVYVVVTRGEKPTSGFEVSIDRITLGEENGKSVLSVYADFTDPEPGNSISQILTYPLQVAETSLTELPDKIELRVQYK